MRLTQINYCDIIDIILMMNLNIRSQLSEDLHSSTLAVYCTRKEQKNVDRNYNKDNESLFLKLAETFHAED